MLRFLLPALIPSWRFFDRIGPSPRVECMLERLTDVMVRPWQEVRRKPEHVTPASMILGLFWNPRGNESLYLVSCAERLLDEPSPGRAAELWRRAADMLRADGVLANQPPDLRLRVRVVQVAREDGRPSRHVAYVSEARRLDGRDGERPR